MIRFPRPCVTTGFSVSPTSATGTRCTQHFARQSCVHACDRDFRTRPSSSGRGGRRPVATNYPQSLGRDREFSIATGVVQPRVVTYILGHDRTWGRAKPGLQQGFPSSSDGVSSRLVVCRDTAIVSRHNDETCAHLLAVYATTSMIDTRACTTDTCAHAIDGLCRDREFSVTTEFQ